MLAYLKSRVPSHPTERSLFGGVDSLGGAVGRGLCALGWYRRHFGSLPTQRQAPPFARWASSFLSSALGYHAVALGVRLPAWEKAMIEQERRDRNGQSYVRFLLQDKQRELRSLELRYSRTLIPWEVFYSCRRSLLQAISQLESLLRGDTEREPTPEMHSPKNDSADIPSERN